MRTLLQQTARPFPQDGADNGNDPTPVAACRAPDGSDQLQCYCPNPSATTPSLCGAGMLDANAAVAAALGVVVAPLCLAPWLVLRQRHRILTRLRLHCPQCGASLPRRAGLAVALGRCGSCGGSVDDP